MFKRDTGRVCNGISFLCFALWSFSHIVWHSTSSEAASNSGGSGASSTSSTSAGVNVDAAPAWVWVDVAVAWAIAPLAGGSLELSLWGSVVPSWACVTVALGYGLRAEEVRQKSEHFSSCSYSYFRKNILFLLFYFSLLVPGIIYRVTVVTRVLSLIMKGSSCLELGCVREKSAS